MVKLSPVDQYVFCSIDKTVFFPAPGVGGKQGATFVELAKVSKEIFEDALTTVFLFVTGTKELYRSDLCNSPRFYSA